MSQQGRDGSLNTEESQLLLRAEDRTPEPVFLPRARRVGSTECQRPRRPECATFNGRQRGTQDTLFSREIYKLEGKCPISTILCHWERTGEYVPQVMDFMKRRLQMKSQIKNENLEYNPSRKGGAPCSVCCVLSPVRQCQPAPRTVSGTQQMCRICE